MGHGGLGRGFEPLGKGLKPFAFTKLCHASWSFSRSGSGVSIGNLVGYIT